MLKRPRHSSPPPSKPTIPLVDFSPIEMLPQHASKRRRMLPPILDGQSRGWGRPDIDGDEDEECQSDEEYYPHDRDDRDSTLPSDFKSEYTSTNTLLNELHILQQHRVIFSPPIPSPTLSMPSHILPTEAMPPTHHISLPYTKSHPHLTQSPERPSAQSKDNQIGCCGMDATDELLRVRGRYEDTNRLLGSLFLSRRRQRDSSLEHITGS